MPARSLFRRASTALGLLAAAVAPAGAATATPSSPLEAAPALSPGDPFASVPESSAVGAPTVAEGTVGIEGTTRSAPARTRIDVYRTPGAAQAPIPFAWALTDDAGAFTLRALPGPLADGQLHTLDVIVSSPGGAATTAKVQVQWDGAAGAWSRIDIDPATTGAIARHTLGGAGLRIDLPNVPQATRSAPTASTRSPGAQAAAAPPACRPVTTPGAIIALPPANITTGAALIQPKLNEHGNPDERLNWSIHHTYDTARTTFVENVDNVALKADFSGTFGGVSLGVSGERSLAASTASGDDTWISNTFATTSTVLEKSLLGLDWRSWAQTYECIDYPRTYAAGTYVYSTAYLSLELARLTQSDAVIGQRREVFHRLDVDPETKKYVRPCGESKGGKRYEVLPGSSFTRATGSSQSFENGMTFKLGAGIAGVQGSRTRSERSRIQYSANAKTTWTNNSSTSKYVCGYEARPSDRYNDPGFVVALGADPQ